MSAEVSLFIVFTVLSVVEIAQIFEDDPSLDFGVFGRSDVERVVIEPLILGDADT